jgi:hypothetical protein
MKTLLAFSCFTLLLLSAGALQAVPTGSLLGMGFAGDGQLAGIDSNEVSGTIDSPEGLGPTNVTAVSAGYYHCLWLQSDGSMWGVGQETIGQLGNGTFGAGTGYTNIPVEIQSNGVIAISAGYDFSLFLKSDGTMWGMGDQGAGELGDGTYGSSVDNYGTNMPVKITNGVVAISAGYQHSLFIKTDGSLWAMGDNTYGEYGNGGNASSDVPVEIQGSNVTAIAAGQYFSLFIKNDGSLWGTGDGTGGNLGNGRIADVYAPFEIATNNVVAASAGGLFSLFLKTDGSLWGMGLNYYGQLGNTNVTTPISRPFEITTNVIAMAAGDYHSLFIRGDGSLWAMGQNSYGQLGDGTYGGDLGYTNQPEMITNGVIAVAAAYDDSLFVMGTAGPPPGYNQLTYQNTTGAALQFTYIGTVGTNYVLDRTFNLSPIVTWLPQETNTAGPGGVVEFFNTPDPATNNFWRVRALP